jgi:hypothetical protein
MNNRVAPPVGGQHILGCFAPAAALLNATFKITLPR